MDHKDLIGLLEGVERVEPPPFLFTRIEARLAERKRMRVPQRWLVAAGLAAVMLLVLNVMAIRRDGAGRSAEGPALQELASTFGLSSSNQLYND